MTEKYESSWGSSLYYDLEGGMVYLGIRREPDFDIEWISLDAGNLVKFAHQIIKDHT